VTNKTQVASQKPAKFLGMKVQNLEVFFTSKMAAYTWQLEKCVNSLHVIVSLGIGHICQDIGYSDRSEFTMNDQTSRTF